MLLGLLGASAFAQESPLRDKGYKGSVSVSYAYPVYAGIETSHGYMFNSHHYLGVGAAAFLFPDGEKWPSFGEAYLAYQAYILKKDSTPFLGVKAGYVRDLAYRSKVEDSGNLDFHQGVTLQPEVGWSWAFRPGVGLSLSVGADLIVPVGESYKKFYALPKLTVSFEF